MVEDVKVEEGREKLLDEVWLDDHTGPQAEEVESFVHFYLVFQFVDRIAVLVGVRVEPLFGLSKIKAFAVRSLGLAKYQVHPEIDVEDEQEDRN